MQTVAELEQGLHLALHQALQAALLLAVMLTSQAAVLAVQLLLEPPPLAPPQVEGLWLFLALLMLLGRPPLQYQQTRVELAGQALVGILEAHQQAEHKSLVAAGQLCEHLPRTSTLGRGVIRELQIQQPLLLWRL
jgi:hypothetical protein